MVIVQAMKIAVCVKEVPDAAAPKRIDPADEPPRPLGAKAR